jgi:hypothetical protein
MPSDTVVEVWVGRSSKVNRREMLCGTNFVYQVPKKRKKSKGSCARMWSGGVGVIQDKDVQNIERRR